MTQSLLCVRASYLASSPSDLSRKEEIKAILSGEKGAPGARAGGSGSGRMGSGNAEPSREVGNAFSIFAAGTDASIVTAFLRDIMVGPDRLPGGQASARLECGCGFPGDDA